jgi:hypothetical protein
MPTARIESPSREQTKDSRSLALLRVGSHPLLGYKGKTSSETEVGRRGRGVSLNNPTRPIVVLLRALVATARRILPKRRPRVREIHMSDSA